MKKGERQIKENDFNAHNATNEPNEINQRNQIDQRNYRNQIAAPNALNDPGVKKLCNPCMSVGAADKAAIQQVKVLPYQLPVSDA